MATAKTATLTFRIEPGLKEALRAVIVTPKAFEPAYSERKVCISSHVL